MSFQIGDKVVNLLDMDIIVGDDGELKLKDSKVRRIGTIIAKPKPNDVYYLVEVGNGVCTWQAGLMRKATEEEVLLYEQI